MGLVMEGDKEVVLTDILGSEDHLGDMDFKVAGTQKGITALQMDVKIAGVSSDLMRRALQQAHEGRMFILRKMLEVLEAPREEVSKYAPRLVIIKIDPERIGDIIGPGGKIIRSIQEQTGCKIDIEDDGTVMIGATKPEADAEACRSTIEAMVGEIEVGTYYTGPVTGVRDFGAFVEIVPGRDGMVHVSELSDEYVKNPSDVVKVGDVMKVKVIGVDDQNRIKLSRKAVLMEEKGEEYKPSAPRGGGGGGGRGGRGGRRK
jgi:polyribonucleotide nucleotidyltransferase